MSLVHIRAETKDTPRPIAFHKYSSHGNHFVLVDELASPPLDEASKSEFARRATDAYAGIGADNTIFVQQYSAAVLKEIQDARGYWPKCPQLDPPPQAVIRFFEPNGQEFLTCGNALMCVAQHMHLHHGVDTMDVMVEVPFRMPHVCSIGYRKGPERSVLSLRPDTARLPEFVGDAFPRVDADGALCFHSLGLEVEQARPIVLSGMIVYSGEPHLVLFQLDGDAKPPGWPDALPWEMRCPDLFADTRPQDGGLSLNALGRHLNRRIPGAFPQGINVNVARPCGDAASLEFRCFERGLYRETLACGTGALAVSMAAGRLGILQGRRTRMFPYLGRRHERYRNAEIVVEREQGARYSLTSASEYIFSGTMPRSQRAKS